MKKLLFLLLIFSGVSLAGAQLTEDQVILRDDLLVAFEQRDTWTNYAVNYQLTDELGWTIFSPRSNQWLTRSETLSISAEVEPAQITGNFEQNLSQLDSAFAQTEADVQIWAFSGDAEALRLTDDSEETENADYADYPFLADLLSAEKRPIPSDLLGNMTAIYDLGIENRVQGYQVILDFAASLPNLSFNPDGFLTQFNGLVELGFLRDSLAESSTLTLYAYFDTETGDILNLSLILEITLEISGEPVVAIAEGDGIFTLDYGRTWSLNYER